ALVLSRGPGRVGSAVRSGAPRAPRRPRRARTRRTALPTRPGPRLSTSAACPINDAAGVGLSAQECASAMRFSADRPLGIAPATINDYRELARRRLPRQLFDYVDG